MGSGGGDEEFSNGDRVSLWLMNADGRGAVRGTLRRFRLPEAFDTDLIDKTIHAAELMDERGDRIDNVAAWTRHTLGLRARDLLRSPGSRRAAAAATHDDGADLVAALPDRSDELGRLAVELDVGELRRQLGSRWGEGHPWRVSASLTYLSVAVDGGSAPPRCPRPTGGADEFDAAHWAGLFYAGVRDVFPFGGEDTPAVRQRRKRRIDQVRAAIIESHALAGLGDDG